MIAPGWEPHDKTTQDKFRELINKSIELKVPCLNNPEKWTDYPEVETPTPEEAKILCYGCPLQALCLDYARGSSATCGVWGGKVFTQEGEYIE